MPNLNPKRFSDPDILGRINPESLVEWLAPARAYLASRGVVVPESTAGGVVNLEALADVFMSPEPGMPTYLVDSLDLVNEMADQHGMDAILEAMHDTELPQQVGDDPDPADVAVRAWLLDKVVLEEIHVQHQLTRPRSCEYFTTDAEPVPPFEVPSDEALRALEARLDNWYAEHKRGRGCKVRAFPKDGECWFLVRHGLPCKRESVMDGDGTGSVFYRPQKHDVLAYNEERGEIRVNCCGVRELKEFLGAFGAYVFGREDFFPGDAKYQFAPLLTGRDCLAWGDVPGIESVTLREVEFFFGGKPWQRVTRTSEDIFTLVERESLHWPDVDRITRAGFEIKFGEKKTRRVTIIGANKAQYGRDDDSVKVEAWLKLRKFVRPPAEHQDDAEPEMATANGA